jgi:DNA repair protein RadD
MILRDYQEKNLAEMRAALAVHQSVLYVSPCGSGKGSTCAYIVNRCVERNKRVIFAVHGKALVHDMSGRVTRLGIPHGVLMGSYKRERWHPVQIASIDTLHRMAHPPKAELIIADEADTALSPTWRKTIAQFPESKLIGMTATPCRLDSQGLGRVSGGLFDAMVLGPSEQELIDMGHLVGSRVLAPPPPADLGNIKITAGEFNPKQQAAVCDKATVIGDIVAHWKKHTSDRKTVAFAVDQAHAQHITDQFNEAGVGWAYVDADTPDSERDLIWRDLRNETGTLMGVASVGCVSVGWDMPIVSCLISARKTASLRLWRQQLGRGSRTYAGKKNFTVLDHVGNTHLHHPYGMFEDAVPWSLDGDAIKKQIGDKAPALTTCKTPVTIDGKLHLPCYATFKTGPDRCPYCGLPIAKAARKIHEEAGELKEVTRDTLWDEPLNGKPPAGFKFNDGHRAVWHDLQRQALERGWKDKAAAIRFKKRFSIWPPKAWQEARP